MRKLIIQVPCFNEAEVLADTLSALPRHVPGFDRVEWLIIDDGSRDGTADVAARCGADHVVVLPQNKGLARAFMAGIEASLKAGADVIVNTDADNQYDAGSIPDLVRPIVDGTAQIVIGTRPIMQVREFSLVKKLLQRLGSAVVKIASRAPVPDAPSGFRAIHREAALRMCVFNDYTYTLETIIQAGRNNVSLMSVDVKVNPVVRPSRLVKSIPSYVRRSLFTILRIFILYKPLRFFLTLGTLFLIPGIALGVRFLVHYLADGGAGHIQSLILTAILLVSAVLMFLAGIITDLIAANRVLLEEVRMRLLRSEVEAARADSERSAAPTDEGSVRERAPSRVGRA
jgi:glycosyltransferase involved in cell wall biosynthesis